MYKDLFLLWSSFNYKVSFEGHLKECLFYHALKISLVLIYSHWNSLVLVYSHSIVIVI